MGVFVNEPGGRVADLMRRIRLHVAQLHGDETPEQYPADVRVWKAARVDDGFNWEAWAANPAEALLLDSAPAGVYGGSGQTFDWQRVAGAPRQIILAGGLDATNVARGYPAGEAVGRGCVFAHRSARRDERITSKMAAFVKAALEASDSLEAKA